MADPLEDTVMNVSAPGTSLAFLLRRKPLGLPMAALSAVAHAEPVRSSLDLSVEKHRTTRRRRRNETSFRANGARGLAAGAVRAADTKLAG